MPIEIIDQDADGISKVRVTGTVQEEDFPGFTSGFERLVSRHHKLRIFFDMSEFKGWSAGALWPEIKFDSQHFSEIERLAAVGSKAWEQGLMGFAKPFTNATIRYFDVAEAGAAREWLIQRSPE